MRGFFVRFESVVARPPLQTTSRNGVTWTRIKCDVLARDEATNTRNPLWVNVSMPGEQGDQYMNLQAGDRIRVEGLMELSTYVKDGRPQIGLAILPTKIERLGEGSGEPDSPADALSTPASLARARHGLRRRR